LKVESGGGGRFVRIDSPKTTLRKDTTAVKKTYHIVNRDEKTATASIEQFAKSNGQLLLPLLELITQARVAVDEVISSIGRKTIETILTLSAEHVAGAQTPGKISGDFAGTVRRTAGWCSPTAS
jgi:hypothetical protein